MKLFKTSVYHIVFPILLLAMGSTAHAQSDAKVTARTDATTITVGDQARLFIEVQHNATQSHLQWAVIPDSFNHLEVVEKGKIDTIKQGDLVTYRQRLLITGFDSGSYQIPALVFPVVPNNGTSYNLQTDSFQLAVQTVPVDTAKPYKPIKDIIYVKSTWLDYIWIFVGVLVLVILITIVAWYFATKKKKIVPEEKPKGPVETLQQKTLRLLRELDQEQLWQKGRVKEYYTQLTDILRTYIEERFQTPAMELTTDELLLMATRNREMQSYVSMLSQILHTADLAKFAKAQPLPQEHTLAMENATNFVGSSTPIATEPTPQQPS